MSEDAKMGGSESPFRYKHISQVCPVDGGELWYWYASDGRDPRWVCINEGCPFWGIA